MESQDGLGASVGRGGRWVKRRLRSRCWKRTACQGRTSRKEKNKDNAETRSALRRKQPASPWSVRSCRLFPPQRPPRLWVLLFLFFSTRASLASGALPATRSQPSLYPPPAPPYTGSEAILRLHPRFQLLLRALSLSVLFAALLFSSSQAQHAPQKPTEKTDAKAPTPAEPQNPAQFELLETTFRFESNGDSRKQVHVLVHINSDLGVRQFARLNFDYNRSVPSIQIPLVHITHPGGGTADILPSAITDNPNPAVVNAPAYQDVRVKSVRILGLEPGDTLEYRVITTTTHHPLAPDFWLDHSFDRSGIVTQEVFELDLPSSRIEEAQARAFESKTDGSSSSSPF